MAAIAPAPDRSYDTPAQFTPDCSYPYFHFTMKPGNHLGVTFYDKEYLKEYLMGLSTEAMQKELNNIGYNVGVGDPDEKQTHVTLSFTKQQFTLLSPLGPKGCTFVQMDELDEQQLVGELKSILREIAETVVAAANPVLSPNTQNAVAPKAKSSSCFDCVQ